jgi:hypothetical protein
MRLLQIITKVVLITVVYMSLLTGCVVVERPYHSHGGYGEHYHGYNGRHCD